MNTPPNITKAIADAERLCRLVASRELAGKPLYIVPVSSLPDEWHGERHYGFTCTGLDLQLRSFVDWRGRGPAFLINDIAIANDADPRDVEYDILTTAIHELGHVVDRPRLFARPLSDATLREHQPELLACLATDEEADIRIPPWLGHEPNRWLRIVLHLRYRVEVVTGKRITAASVCGVSAWPGMGISHPDLYDRELRDEFKHMAGMPFVQIMETKPPAEYSQLWLEDYFRWLNEREELNDDENESQPAGHLVEAGGHAA